MPVTETIQEILEGIDDAQYGRDMRDLIHKGIQKCYEEGSAGETDLVARESVEKILEIFGDVESGDTASKAYAVGDSVIYDGRLYKVIASIAQGDTFTVDTNIEEAMATSNVGDLYELPFNSMGNSKLYIMPSIKLMILNIKYTVTPQSLLLGGRLPIPIGVSSFYYTQSVHAPVYLEPSNSSSTGGMAGEVALRVMSTQVDENMLSLTIPSSITESMEVRGTLIAPYWRLNSHYPFSEATPVSLNI